LGEFAAGKWLVYLMIYFICLFLVTTWILNFSVEYPNTDANGANINAGNIFVSTVNSDGLDNYSQQEISVDSSIKPATLLDSLSFLSGFGADNFNLGMPDGIKYIMNFILFYIPLFMFAFSVYMILPFFH